MRNRAFLFFVALLLPCIPYRSPAAFEFEPAGPRSRACGGADIAAGPDGWSCFGNPGVLAFQQAVSCAFYHSPGLFGLSELAYSGGGVAVPVGQWGLAVVGTVFGGSLYKESSMRISAGTQWFRGVGGGIRIRLNSLSIGGYGSCTGVTIDAGMRISCSDAIAIAGTITNITATTLGNTGEPLPQMVEGGIWYTAGTGISIGLGLEKEVLFDLGFRCAAEITVVRSFVLRAGWSDTPGTLTAGCSVGLGRFVFTYGFGYHWVLGSTHEIGIVFNPG